MSAIEAKRGLEVDLAGVLTRSEVRQLIRWLDDDRVAEALRKMLTSAQKNARVPPLVTQDADGLATSPRQMRGSADAGTPDAATPADAGKPDAAGHSTRSLIYFL